jgi:glycosyltransferase involved in cell wall biosynthesis
MKKILFIAPRFHTNQYYTIKNLNKKNKVFFISLYKGKIENYRHIQPKVISQSFYSKKLQSFFNFRYDTFYFPNFAQLFKIIGKIKPDIVIIRIYSRPLLYISSLISKIFKAKIIYYDQTPTTGYKNLISFCKYLELTFAKFFFGAAWYSPILLEPSKKNSLPFVVKTKKHINKINKNFKILMIGKFQSRKCHILLIYALIKLIRNYKVKLTMIGEVSNKEHIKNYKFIKNFLSKKNLDKHCILKKNINFQKIESEYIKCNLFVLPSYSEPAAISILEAQGYGRPVICSDTCGTKNYLAPSSSRIFKSNNINSLTKSIQFFLDRKHIYEKFVIKAHNNAKKKFSENQFEKSFSNFLDINF